jgi:N6-adenosine-specific RNA methylase IME4
MELGRTLMKKWGYDVFDELVWIKVTRQNGLLRQKKTGSSIFT